MTTRQNAQLWAVLLVPALMWGLHLQISYALHSTACDTNNRLLLIAISLVTMIPVALMARLGLILLRSLPEPLPGGLAGAPEEAEPRPRGRARFMAAAGVAGACFFALLILGQTVPMVMLRPCD